MIQVLWKAIPLFTSHHARGLINIFHFFLIQVFISYDPINFKNNWFDRLSE